MCSNGDTPNPRLITRDMALNLFMIWRDSAASIRCRFRERPLSFTIRGKVTEVFDGLTVRLRGDNAELLFEVADVFTSIEDFGPRALTAEDAFARCLIFRVDVEGSSIFDVVFEELINPS